VRAQSFPSIIIANLWHTVCSFEVASRAFWVGGSDNDNIAGVLSCQNHQNDLTFVGLFFQRAKGNVWRPVVQASGKL